MYKNSIGHWKWLFVVSWLIAENSVAEIRGIVVGINQYPKIPNGNLEGAVNDARDVAEALNFSGAKEVKILLDTQATRAAIVDAWQSMLKKSVSGDVLLFSFAGHGFQLPELVRGTEVDGMDEALALTDFQRSPLNNPLNKEFLRDDDIATFLKQAADSAIKVLFLADACHSGTMTRGVDNTVRKFKFRALPAITRGLADIVYDDADLPANKIAASIEVEKLPGISYVGAVQDFQLAPETIIDGDPRGALSWAAAKAIRGNGDVNHDGIITDTEFMNYVRDTVVIRMEGQQQPSLPQKHGFPCTPLLTFNNIPNSSNIKSNAIITSSSPLPIAIINAIIPAPYLIAQLKGTRLVTDNSAILTWNTQRGEILGTLGDVVANVHTKLGNPEPCPIPSRTRGMERLKAPTTTLAVLPLPVIKATESKECASSKKDLEAELPRVQLVVDKFTMIETLRPYTEGQPMTIAIEPEDKIFKDKEPLSITVSGLSYAYFTLFNLSSDGTVNFLYPLRTDGYNDPFQIPSEKPYRLDLTVQPPFGADHFVALSSAVELTQLHVTLTQLNGKPEAANLLEILKVQLATTNIQVGMRGVYTGVN